MLSAHKVSSSWHSLSACMACSTHFRQKECFKSWRVRYSAYQHVAALTKGHKVVVRHCAHTQGMLEPCMCCRAQLPGIQAPLYLLNDFVYSLHPLCGSLACLIGQVSILMMIVWELSLGWLPLGTFRKEGKSVNQI